MHVYSLELCNQVIRTMGILRLVLLCLAHVKFAHYAKTTICGDRHLSNHSIASLLGLLALESSDQPLRIDRCD
jgi:hypothetical protein